MSPRGGSASSVRPPVSPAPGKPSTRWWTRSNRRTRAQSCSGSNSPRPPSFRRSPIHSPISTRKPLWTRISTGTKRISSDRAPSNSCVTRPGQPPSARDQLVKELGDQIAVQESDWNCGNLLTYNHKRKPFDDVRVRRALSLAIDQWKGAPALSKIAIVRTVAGIVFPGSPLAATKEELQQLAGFWPDIEKSRVEAKRLLKEAGAENYGGYEDPAEIELYQKMLREADPAKQRLLMREFEKYVIDTQAHELPLTFWYRIVPYRSYVKGWKISPSHFVNQDLATIWLDK